MAFVPPTQQASSSDQTLELEMIGVMVLLLIFSAIPATSKWALYVGLFLLFITWWSASQNGTLTSFGKELIS